ncbi:hypothetical protein [Ignavigranum ruoffiae]|uniref:hypothetical protein n=1 Tax=Ignavigranum ruoffiae TaxID=89093 RepID=UPI0024ACE9B0|nr:hypothetical protein [Ignavigranum ruoffiae]
MDAYFTYPELVEEAYNFYQNSDLEIDKLSLWRNMVELGILDHLGQPTTAAINSGLVREFVEEENLSLAEFKEVYPVFDRYPDQFFIFQDGFWQVHTDLLELIQTDIEEASLSAIDVMELEAYFNNQIDDIFKD